VPVADGPDKDQQTEAPTAKRKADAMRDGDVLQSRELATALMMLAGALWLYFSGSWIFSASQRLLVSGLSLDLRDPDSFDPLQELTVMAAEIALPVASLFGMTLFAAIAGPAVLGSAGIRGKALVFKGSRINPLSGMKRIFGIQGLIELAKAIAKVAALGVAGYWTVTSQLPDIIGLASGDPASAVSRIGSSISLTVIILAAALLLIAGIDVPIAWLQRNARLKMSKQQMKEEIRQSDGAPELKQAQRARQQEMLMGSARKGMVDANVVLTNPTHFAVALRYRPGLDAAPIVVARGRGEVALAIRQLAKESHIPALEYPQLTRAIYFTTRAGRAVSEDLYIAVAAILAFVFQLDKMVTAELRQPNVDVPQAKRFDAEGELAS
jgi:flagellar biosynthesis protein FlhB